LLPEYPKSKQYHCASTTLTLSRATPCQLTALSKAASILEGIQVLVSNHERAYNSSSSDKVKGLQELFQQWYNQRQKCVTAEGTYFKGGM
jgi:hypothetical protein